MSSVCYNYTLINRAIARFRSLVEGRLFGYVIFANMLHLDTFTFTIEYAYSNIIVYLIRGDDNSCSFNCSYCSSFYEHAPPFSYRYQLQRPCTKCVIMVLQTELLKNIHDSQSKLVCRHSLDLLWKLNQECTRSYGTVFSVYSNKLPVTCMHMEADQLLCAIDVEYSCKLSPPHLMYQPSNIWFLLTCAHNTLCKMRAWRFVLDHVIFHDVTNKLTTNIFTRLQMSIHVYTNNLQVWYIM